jgi:hypothetical protein
MVKGSNNLRRPGRSLAHSIVNDFASSICEPPEELKPASQEPNPFEHYQGDPIGFCKNIFGVEFTEEVEDMLTAAQERPSVLAKSANGTGKTFAAACFVLYWFLVYDDAQVYTTAAPPVENLQLLLWGEIGSLIEKHPHVFARFKVSIVGMLIKRADRSFITGLAIPQSQDPAQIKARFSGKHAPHILFVFDEGDGVPEPVYRGAEACMSGGMARQLILFNPRSETGPVARMEREKEAYVVTLKAFNHPNVITGKDLIPGAVDRETTVRRIHLWTEPLRGKERPGNDCFEVPAFLVGAVAHTRAGEPLPPLVPGWRRIVDPSFSYMVLGEYPTQGENQLISSAWVDAAETRWLAWAAQYGERPPQGVRPVLSYDVAELGKDSNVVFLWYGNWVARPFVWNGVDVVSGGDKAADYYFQNGAVEAFVDATGVGAGAWGQMKKRRCVAHRIMVGSSKDLENEIDEIDDTELSGFDKVRSQMLWALREWLRTDSGAMIPPVRELREELLVPTYDKDNQGRIVVCKTETIKEKLNGRSPDYLMALALRKAKAPGSKAGQLGTGNYAKGRGKQRDSGRVTKSGLVMV